MTAGLLAPNVTLQSRSRPNVTVASRSARLSQACHQQIEHAARLVRRAAGQKDPKQTRHHIVGSHIGAKAAVVGAGPHQHVDRADDACSSLTTLDGPGSTADSGLTVNQLAVNGLVGR
jgi:hypothetical protein